MKNIDFDFVIKFTPLTSEEFERFEQVCIRKMPVRVSNIYEVNIILAEAVINETADVLGILNLKVYKGEGKIVKCLAWKPQMLN